VNLTAEGVKKVLHRLRRRVRKVIDENLPQIGMSRSEQSKVVSIEERRRGRERLRLIGQVKVDALDTS
jgi:hypothetical protein